MLFTASELADALGAAGVPDARELAEAVQRQYQPKGRKPG
jgi:hypothetical protein